MDIYNKALKYMTDVMGNGITDSIQLHEAGKELFGRKFKGVFPADKVPKLTRWKPYAIMNLDSSDEFGSHWVAVIKDGGDTLFYDSFGRKASKIMPTLGSGVINTELDAEQDLNGKVEANCGQRSLTALFVFDQFGRKKFLSL